MHTITKTVDNIITRAARNTVTKGGEFDYMRNLTIKKVEKRFPGLDKGILLGGFNHRYVEVLSRMAV